MCRRSTMSSEDGEDKLLEQVQRNNEHFKGLLDLIPPQAYFSQEDKDEIWGNTDWMDDGEEWTQVKRKKSKKAKGSLSSMTVTQISEMRERGETPGQKKRKVVEENSDGDEDEGIPHLRFPLEAKQRGKKRSRSSKGNKLVKAKELKRRQERLGELKKKLHQKILDIKAKKLPTKGGTSKLQSRLIRKEKKVNAKLRKKKVSSKEQRIVDKHTAASGLRSPPHKDILNANGQPVRSKFDFSTISFGDEKAKSELQGRDYKRLLEKLERRSQKVAKLKEANEEAGQKLESKLQWQGVLNRAQGEKVKDNVDMLKKAAKRKEKMGEKKKAKWEDRMKTVKEQQKKRQDRRQANLDKRKSDKLDKKRKKLVKKGRMIPGF